MGSAASPSFEVRTDVRNGVARLALIGELDFAVAPRLQETLDRVTSDGVTAALLDLRELRFMDSAGLHLFIRAADLAKQNGHRLAIVGVEGAPRRLLEISRMEGVLIDEPEGMALIGQFTASEQSRNSYAGGR